MCSKVNSTPAPATTAAAVVAPASIPIAHRPKDQQPKTDDGLRPSHVGKEGFKTGLNAEEQGGHAPAKTVLGG